MSTFASSLSFDIDSIDERERHHYPLLRLLRRYECELSAGETLFVPSGEEQTASTCCCTRGWSHSFLVVCFVGTPHRVFNLTSTIAVSGNYVDETNLDDVLAALSSERFHNIRCDELINVLRPFATTPTTSTAAASEPTACVVKNDDDLLDEFESKFE